MDEFAKLSVQERSFYFEKTASEKNFNILVVEKDFWVCWVIKRLFSMPELSAHLTFKGGTSLSKAFGIIRRFSEDIDITINRSFFGFVGEKDPADKSREKREKLLDELRGVVRIYIQGDLLKKLSEEFARQLGSKKSWKLYPDSEDPDQQSLVFEYHTEQTEKSGYLRSAIKIEFGARGEDWPSETCRLKSFVAEVIPDAMKTPHQDVQVLSPRRTFWEKATILHSYYYWPETKEIPSRQSRHYYDLFCLLKSSVAFEVAKEPELLEKVADHKK